GELRAGLGAGLARPSRDRVSAVRARDARVDPGRSRDPGRGVLRGSGLVNRWRVIFTKQAQKDAKKLAAAGLRSRAERLLALLAENPYQTPPPYEKLLGDLAGAYSRRINIQHRLVYQVEESQRVVKVIRMWTHYE